MLGPAIGLMICGMLNLVAMPLVAVLLLAKFLAGPGPRVAWR